MEAIPTDILSNFWAQLGIVVAVWLFFAGYITPKLIAYFLSTRDLANSPLASKLADYFAERAMKRLELDPETIIPKVMEWAADEKNRPMLDAVLRNALQTEAVTQALNQVFEEAKNRIKAMFEGQMGADRKEIIGEFSKVLPAQAQAILEHPKVETFLHLLQVAGTIATAFGRRPQNE